MSFHEIESAIGHLHDKIDRIERVFAQLVTHIVSEDHMAKLFPDLVASASRLAAAATDIEQRLAAHASIAASGEIVDPSDISAVKQTIDVVSTGLEALKTAFPTQAELDAMPAAASETGDPVQALVDPIHPVT